MNMHMNTMVEGARTWSTVKISANCSRTSGLPLVWLYSWRQGTPLLMVRDAMRTCRSKCGRLSLFWQWTLKQCACRVGRC